ncbi:recombinase family protein [Clostridium sp. DL1XJH146]
MSYRNVYDFRELTQSDAPIQLMSVATKLALNTEEKVKKLRVASYCRVSTEEEMQQGSLENQIIHYTNLIRSNPEWRYAGVFSDLGKSGTRIEHRIGFNKMIRSAINGEIDLIICKSLSRFARNVADTLSVIKELDKVGVRVLFEKENIGTGTSSGTFLINVLAALAEEESRNISENINWAYQRRFEMGEVAYRRLLGYKMNKNKEWEIVDREAATVKLVFKQFLEGKKLSEIANYLIRNSYQKKNGRSDWSGVAVKALLTNEWYCGDALSRKTYTVNHLSHKIKINNGERPQYYIENHHQAVIDKEIFKKVQKLLTKNKTTKNRGKRIEYPLTSRLVCSTCGGNFHRFKKKDDTIIWRCSNRTKSRRLCNAEPLKEELIDRLLKYAFIKRYNIQFKSDNTTIVNRLKRELENANSARESAQALLRVELEKILITENNAILNELPLDSIKERRIAIENKINKETPIWESFDKDEAYRRSSLKKLKSLGKDVYVFKDILNIELIRAWVIRIEVESPFIFTIIWIDGTEERFRYSQEEEFNEYK